MGGKLSRNQAHACYGGAEIPHVKRLTLLAEDALEKGDIEGARSLLEEINADKTK